MCQDEFNHRINYFRYNYFKTLSMLKLMIKNGQAIVTYGEKNNNKLTYL